MQIVMPSLRDCRGYEALEWYSNDLFAVLSFKYSHASAPPR